MSEFFEESESESGSRRAETVQIEIALVRWVRGQIDVSCDTDGDPDGDAACEASPAAPESRARGLAAATAGVVTFVCTLVIAVGTVLLCYLTIR